MLIRSVCKYISVGLFVVYGTLTLNLLSWVSKHHKHNQTIQDVLGSSNNVRELEEVIDQGEVEYTDKNYEDILKYMENNAKRKRKILTELLKQYEVKSDKNRTDVQFRMIGNIYVFSAYFDDRINFEYEVPVTRIMGISRMDSEEMLVCRYTDTGSDSWILAVKLEMSDNHWKKYGGFMYVCNTPPDIGIVPRKIYLQSLSSLGDKGQGSPPVCLDVHPIRSGRLSLLGRLMEGQDTDSVVNHYYQLSDTGPDGAATGEAEMAIDNGDGVQHSEPGEVEMVINNGYGAKHSESATEESVNVPSKKENNGAEADRGSSNAHGESSQHKEANNSGVKYETVKKENKESLNETKGEETKSEEKLKTRMSIAVCIPPLFGSIPLSNFIQWIEMLQIQGVSHIFAYRLNVSRNIEQMLAYYAQQGFLTIIDWALPTHVAPGVWNHGQIVAVQDCLYKTIGLFDYTAFIDIDELIIPKKHSDWPTLLTSLEQSTSNQWGETGGYIFQSAFFDPDYPTGSNENQPFKHSSLSFIRNIQRTEMFSKVRTKVIVKPDLIDQMGIHHVSRVLNTTLEVATHEVDPAVSPVHHYRPCTQVSDPDMDCRAVIIDSSVWRYETTLTRKYDVALQENLAYLEKTDYKMN